MDFVAQCTSDSFFPQNLFHRPSLCQFKIGFLRLAVISENLFHENTLRIFIGEEVVCLKKAND